MTKSKYELSLEGASDLEKGNINLKNKKFENASKNFEKAIVSYQLSLSKDSGDRDPENLDEVTKKNLGSAIKNYGSAMIDLAKELGSSDLNSNLDDIVRHLRSAIKVMKEEGKDYEKDLNSNLVAAQQNLATYYYKDQKYDEAIKEFVELKEYNSVDKKKIDPIILNTYSLKAKGDTDQEDTLEEAFQFMTKVEEDTLKSRISDADYVLENLAKSYILNNKDINDINDLYSKVHLDKSLVETLYDDAVFNYQIGKENKDKLVLKESVAVFSFVAKKEMVHLVEIDNLLKSLVSDYGTHDVKLHYENLVITDHLFELNDFDFA